MSSVLRWALLGACLGSLPGLFYLASPDEWESANRDIFFTLLACFGAILGAVTGSAKAIRLGFAQRGRSRSSRAERGLLAGWTAGLRKPKGITRDEWRRQVWIWLAVIVGMILAIQLMLKFLVG